ncbi:MAG: nitrilase family protein [Bacillota bacterium]
MQDTTIALVQMQAKLGAIEENLVKMKHFVQGAAARQVDIICFPEMCIPGYSREPLAEMSEVLEGSPLLKSLADMARLYNMVIIAGLAEKNGADKPFITQLVAYPDGSLDKYRKAHLGKSEQPHYAQGDEIKVFNHPKAKFGIQICWDMHFPEMTTILSLKGCEIIFAPHASPSIVGDRRDIWLKYLPARAYDNTVFIGACNLVGDDGRGHHFCGGALIIDPKGNILAEDFRGKESMLIADLDCTKINMIREQNSRSMANSFYLGARRPELYKDLIGEAQKI